MLVVIASRLLLADGTELAQIVADNPDAVIPADQYPMAENW